MAKVYPTHGEVLTSTVQLGRVERMRVSQERLQRASLREGVVRPVIAILQGMPKILRWVSGISGLSIKQQKTRGRSGQTSERYESAKAAAIPKQRRI
jgi:hypothetical protein